MPTPAAIAFHYFAGAFSSRRFRHYEYFFFTLLLMLVRAFTLRRYAASADAAAAAAASEQFIAGCLRCRRHSVARFNTYTLICC